MSWLEGLHDFSLYPYASKATLIWGYWASINYEDNSLIEVIWITHMARSDTEHRTFNDF